MNNQTNNVNAQNAIDAATALVNRNQQLKDGCCLMNAKVSSPCGESTLSNARVEHNGRRLDSDQVKSSKIQWFPRDRLKLTTKYSNKISRILNANGVKMGDMTVVPIEKLDSVQDQLNATKAEWQDEVEDVIRDFDSILNQHCANNPDVDQLIRDHAVTAQVFKSRFKMSIQCPLALTPLYESDDGAVAEMLSETLWEEISKEANKVYESSWFKNKRPVSRVTQKIRSPLKRIMQKMLSLSFLDEGIAIVCETIDECLGALPKSGHIEGIHFEKLTKWMLVMGDESKLRLHAGGNPQYTEEEASEEAEATVEAEVTAEVTAEANVTTEVEATAEANVTTEVVTPAPVVESRVVTPLPEQESSDFGFGNW